MILAFYDQMATCIIIILYREGAFDVTIDVRLFPDNTAAVRLRGKRWYVFYAISEIQAVRNFHF